MKNILVKKILPMMLTLCMVMTCASQATMTVSADEASAAGLKEYMKTAAGTVNETLKSDNVPLVVAVNDSNEMSVYVNSRTYTLVDLMAHKDKLSGLFSYSGINSLKIEGNEMMGISTSERVSIFVTVYGISKDQIIYSKVIDLIDKPLNIEIGLTSGESVKYTMEFETGLEMYLEESVVEANKVLTENAVPMTMAVNNTTNKIEVTITDRTYAASKLLSVKFLSTMFSYDGISSIYINGEKASNLEQTTLMMLLVKTVFPEKLNDVTALLRTTLGELTGKTIHVKVVLTSEYEAAYDMTFVEKTVSNNDQSSNNQNNNNTTNNNTTNNNTTNNNTTNNTTTTTTYAGAVSNLKVSKKTTNAITLKWTAPTAAAKGYRIVRTANGKKTVTKSTKATTYKFTNLAAGTVYTYKVTPYILDANGNKVYGKTKTIKGITNPKQVTIKKVTTPSKKAIKATWKKVTATGYQIQVSTSNKFTKKTTKTVTLKKNKLTTTVKKLKSGKKYYVRVRAYTKSGSKVSYGKWSKLKNKKTK